MLLVMSHGVEMAAGTELAVDPVPSATSPS
jgi:hypothetical protein